ncbi:MAG: hypothetical protein GWO22_18925, partial [Actinobacteria bacterium]|nr:hypothetical protein [Actinomycetota bacterium]
MPDFSPSGVDGLPMLDAQHLTNPGGDPRILAWLKEAEMEGDAINQADPF